MISKVDIDDWEHVGVTAKPHYEPPSGWVVQMLGPKGWYQIRPGISKDKQDCIRSLHIWKEFWPDMEFRVYEHFEGGK